MYVTVPVNASSTNCISVCGCTAVYLHKWGEHFGPSANFKGVASNCSYFFRSFQSFDSTSPDPTANKGRFFFSLIYIYIYIYIYLSFHFREAFCQLKDMLMLRIRLATLHLILLFPGNARRQRIPNFLRQLTTSILSEFSSLLFVLPSTNIRFFPPFS